MPHERKVREDEREKVDTKVRSDVFPAPLGPSRRNVGEAVREGVRKRRKCNSIGMQRTTKMVMRMIDGLGSRREESKPRGRAHDIFPLAFLSTSAAVHTLGKFQVTEKLFSRDSCSATRKGIRLLIVALRIQTRNHCFIVLWTACLCIRQYDYILGISISCKHIQQILQVASVTPSLLSSIRSVRQFRRMVKRTGQFTHLGVPVIA